MSLTPRSNVPLIAKPMAKKIKKKQKSQHAKFANTAELPYVQEKMSEVIIEYAKPLLYEARTIELQKRAFDIAIFCWNVSLLSADERLKTIEMMTKEDKIGRRGAIEMIIYMISRKLDDYPAINRKIVAYEITETENSGLFLDVASTPKFEP
ncbi:MAG: hypothetical protein SFH39_14320 [Candidatus Magnetobacterium sp. LHC-1]